MYVKVTNGVPTKYTIGELRRDNGNTSFPRNIPVETLAEWNVFPLEETEQPQYDHTKNAVEGTPTQNDEGQWVQVWVLEDATSEEIAEKTENQTLITRQQRNQLLTDTDYLALSDNTLTDAMATYRQALRDITDHSNFPFLNDNDWPVKPE